MADDAALYDIAVPDAAHTLGGIKDDIDPEHPSVLAHMVKSLMPGQDLTRVTIPAFYLEPRSLLERMADTMMHPDLLLGVSKLAEPVERMKAIVKWYLSGWHYKTVGVKKPFNPVIGETFACYWKHEDGSRSQYFAEQVLHRPPISAIYFENRAHNMTASAHVWTKSQFAAPQTTKSILDGGCLLTLTNLAEEYFITFPTYFAHNLLIGTARMEVGDTAHIVCRKTGLRADVEFQQMGMFSGRDRLNGVDARIYRINAEGKKSEDLFQVTGNWDKQMHIAGAKGGKPELFLDIERTPVAPKYVLPLEAQGPWESRRLWRYAAEHLQSRPKVDWDAVDREKGQLEEEQRLLACHAKTSAPEYRDWVTKKFHPKKVTDPITGTTKEWFLFDDINASPYVPGEPEKNLLALSRNLADPRGGHEGAGADGDVVKATRSIKLSAARQKEWGPA